MRFISLTWTSAVSEQEIIVFIDAVHEAIKTAYNRLPAAGTLVPFPDIQLFGDWVLQNAKPGMDYASFQWYQDAAMEADGKQLRSDRFLDLVLNEPWQQDTPHYDLAFVHQPLIDGHKRATLGMAVRGRAAVFTSDTIRGIRDPIQRLVILRRLAMHYVGQILAVPILERQEVVHPQICVMRPADSLPALAFYTQQELEANVTYCKPCQYEMAQRLVGDYFGNN